MRVPVFVVALAALCALPLSGCLEQEPPSAPVEAPTEPETEAPKPLPDPFEAVETMTASVDPMILVDGTTCGPVAQCFVYPFEVPGPAKMEAFLSWEVPANDLDLHLVRPDGSVSSSAATAPGTVEFIGLDLEPGEHRLVVAGFVAVAETFSLSVTFE